MKHSLIALTLVLSGCASTAGKIDSTLGNPKTQDDVRWACIGLEGALALAVKAGPALGANPGVQRAVGLAQVSLGTICTAARAGKLGNAQDAYVTVMDLAGQIVASLPAKP